ncbi:MAG: delta-60 repeat domain-containing protein [Dokdonella sp.]
MDHQESLVRRCQRTALHAPNHRFCRSFTTICPTFALAAAFAASSAMAQDGSFDASWAPRNSDQKGSPGLFEDTYALGGGGIYAGDMTATTTIVQSDGKMLVAGFGWNTAGSTDQNACVMRRYNADGSTDTSFAGGGVFVQNWTSGLSNPKTDCYFKSITLQPDGKILVAGQIVYAVGNDAEGVVERLLPNGSLDTGFNGNGVRKTGIWSDVNSVLLAGNGDIFLAGSWIAPNFSDTDFYLITLDTSGNQTAYTAAHFDVPGSDHNDSGNSAVLESWSSGTIGNFHSHDEVYLVGSANNPSHASGLAHHSCGIAAFRRNDGGPFSLDSGFNGSGLLNVDFPVGTLDTDTICRTATRRPGTTLLGPNGVVVGGERYYTPSGASLGSASYYALEDIDAGGTVTRDDAFAFFADLNEAGAFNSINAMAWDDIGKLVTVGYAGIGANGDQTHVPSDGAIRRFNVDFSVDSSFSADHSGTLLVSLDTSGAGGIVQAQREWLNAVAVDPLHGRMVFAGERSILISLVPNLYAWFLGAAHDGTVQVSDRIFANGFD